jgi:hypothetical protein
MEIIKLIFHGKFNMGILWELELHNIREIEEYGLQKMGLYKIHPAKMKK